MLPTSLRLAWHFYQQEKHNTHQRYLRWTQMLLMVFVMSLTMVSHTVQDYLSDNLANLLGADLVLAQDQAMQPPALIQLQGLAQTVIATQSVNTTLTHSDQWQRAQLKAVGNDYPLQGYVTVAEALNAKEQRVTSGPQPGEIWLDPRLLAGLEISIGDQLTLAGYPFLVSHVLLHEPDRLMESHSTDMRALIHLSDMQALGFEADLLRHRYLVAANSNQVQQIIRWQKNQLPAAELFHKTGAHPLALFWQRVENFLGLTSVILFFMAAIAIEKLTRLQIDKEQYFSAVCMSLGASRTTGMVISSIKWLLGVLAILPMALVLSTLLHWFAVRWLNSTIEGLNWEWLALPALQAFAAVGLIFLVFQLPVWVGIVGTSVSQLITQQRRIVSHWLTAGCAITVLSLVAFTYSDNGLLTAMVLAAMFAAIAVIVVIGWSVLVLSEKATAKVSGLLPFALFMMRQRIINKSTQILGVGLCAFLLLFTLMLMRDLGTTINAYERTHNGNLLVTQATAMQMQDIQQWAQTHAIDIRQHKQFVYGKLIEVNGLNLSEYSDKPSDSMATLASAIRLHWTNGIPSNNYLIDGQWWQPNTRDWQQVSVEQEVMTDLGLAIGDTLRFAVGQDFVDFTIAASHGYRSGAGSITFWVQMPPAALTHLSSPHYSMASLELADEQFPLLGDLWTTHPTLRMTSLAEMTRRFDATLGVLTQAISGFSVLIASLSILVILATVHGIEKQEKRKNSIIMSFGLSKQTCLQLNIIEWVVTGAIAATGAIAGTWIAGVLIYQSQFSLPYQPNVAWLAITLLVILTAVTLLGVIASKHSLSVSIRELLAE